MAAEYILKEGNPNVMLCERGIRTFETAYRFTLDLTAVPVLKELTHLPVIVDPSHAAGPARPRRAAVAGRGRRGRRRHHRRGAPRPRGGDLRRARRRCAPTSFAAYAEKVEQAAAVAGKALSAAGRRVERRVSVAVVGVGLIGGSIGLAARERARARRCAATTPTPAVRERALAPGAVDARPRRSPRRVGGRRRGVRRRARRRAAGAVRAALRGRGAATASSPTSARPSALLVDAASATSASSAATRWRAPRPPASSTRARTCSTARPGT